MKTEKIILWEEGEYTYPLACGFVPNVVSYLHEDEKIRPCMLVVPGGGYCVVSPTEGEIVAKTFYEEGYNAFVLVYTTNLLKKASLKLQPLQDISRAVRRIRQGAETYRIQQDKLAICGFSAGAHLCGSLCVHYEDIKDENLKYVGLSNRPDAAILSYPVITSGEYAHRDSFITLLGEDASKEELEYMSLEKQVTEKTPPCFLWQTVEDETVPVENSYLFAGACKKAGVKYAHHVFTEGRHGLSLASDEWARGEFGEPYPLEQIENIISCIKEGKLDIPKEIGEAMEEQFRGAGQEADTGEEAQKKLERAIKTARIWPVLAKQWLRDILNL